MYLYYFLENQEVISRNLHNECIFSQFDKMMTVPTSEQPSLETFYRDYLKPKIPVKITGWFFIQN